MRAAPRAKADGCAPRAGHAMCTLSTAWVSRWADEERAPKPNCLDARDSGRCDRYNCEVCAGRETCRLAACDWDGATGACNVPSAVGVALSQALSHRWRTGEWVPLLLEVADERLRLVHDGHEYISSLHLPGWDASARPADAPWNLIFGARTSLRVDDHWVGPPPPRTSHPGRSHLTPAIQAANTSYQPSRP